MIKTKRLRKIKAKQPRKIQAPSPRVDGRLKPDSIRKIGRALGGTHWQSDVAKHPKINYSKSMITRLINGTRSPDTMFSHGLRVAMLDKIEDVASLLREDCLDQATAPNTKEGMALIFEALKVLRQRET